MPLIRYFNVAPTIKDAVKLESERIRQHFKGKLNKISSRFAHQAKIMTKLRQKTDSTLEALSQLREEIDLILPDYILSNDNETIRSLCNELDSLITKLEINKGQPELAEQIQISRQNIRQKTLDQKFTVRKNQAVQPDANCADSSTQNRDRIERLKRMRPTQPILQKSPAKPMPSNDVYRQPTPVPNSTKKPDTHIKVNLREKFKDALINMKGESFKLAEKMFNEIYAAQPSVNLVTNIIRAYLKLGNKNHIKLINRWFIALKELDKDSENTHKIAAEIDSWHKK